MHDLHTHSNCSDGILTPSELVQRAAQHGVTTLALTDHDTLAGLPEAQAAAQEQGIQLIPGIELSCQWRGIGVHIIGLNVALDNAELNAGIARQANSRSQRAELIAQKLCKAGLPDTLAGAKRYAGNADVARPHFARYLIEIGAVKDINTAFKRYLGAGKAGDVKQLWPEIEEVVSWIIAAGGLPVLAHPRKYDLTRTKLCDLLEQFVNAGGIGIEVISGSQDKRDTEDLCRLADLYQLRASIGSDFHVPGQSWQELGCAGELPASCTPVWQAFTARQ